MTKTATAPKTSAASTKIRPLADRVLVRRFEAATMSEGGIVIPDKAQEHQTKGEIVAVGPGKKTAQRDADGNVIRIPLDLHVGDHVLYSPYGQGEGIKQGDDFLLLLREDDIMAVLEK